MLRRYPMKHPKNIVMPGNSNPLCPSQTKQPSRSARDLFCMEKAGLPMFLILAIVLVVAWICGFVVFHTAGFLIHLLLLFAVISLIMHFVTGRSAA